MENLYAHALSNAIGPSYASEGVWWPGAWYSAPVLISLAHGVNMKSLPDEY